MAEQENNLDKELLRYRDTVRRIVKDSLVNNPYDLGAWTSVSRFLYYVLDLEPKSLRQLRLHSEIFNGEPLNTLLFSGSENEDVFRARSGYDAIVEGLPEEYLLEEPPVPAFENPLFDGHPTPGNGTPIQIGPRIGGRVQTPDLVRYQGYFGDLYRLGYLDEIAKRDQSDPFIFMEIGAGFGCIPYHLLKRFPKKLSAVVVDLPLMLIFTAVYLKTNLPELSVYLFDPDNPNELPDPQRHDVILVPNYRIDMLESLKGIDLAFNSISMQEMSDSQIVDYLDYLKRKVTGGFYYHGAMTVYPNDDPQWIKGIVGQIKERFNIYPSLHYFHSLAEQQLKAAPSQGPITIRYQFVALAEGAEKNINHKATLNITMPDFSRANVSIFDPVLEPLAPPRRNHLVGRIKRRVKRLLQSV